MQIPITTLEKPQLKDRFSRQYFYLRLSITDICNFRCNYCLPNGYQPCSQRPSFLNVHEIRRLIRAFATLGTEKVRLTGGEPTLRKDFLEIVDTIRQQPEIRTLALTTNGYRMAKQVQNWYQAGITDINVSVDSLDPRQFQSITGSSQFHEIMQGINNAFACGYKKIKVNAVLMRHFNVGEFERFLDWIQYQPIQIRFIELMQTGEMDYFFQQQHLSAKVLVHQLMEKGWQLQQRSKTDGPAKVFKHPNYVGEVGFIMPYEKNFCRTCNRLRISATGEFHLCLFGEEGINIRDLLAKDEQQITLQERLQDLLLNKREFHFLHQGNVGVRANLASIGG